MMIPQLTTRRWVPQGLALGLIALLALALVWPLGLGIASGFQGAGGSGWTLRYVGQVFADPVLRAGLLNSFLIACCVTALSLLIGLPLAMLGVRYEFRGKALLGALVLVPLILPPFVGAIGLQQILGRFGSANTLLAQLGVIDVAHPVEFLGSGNLLGVIVVEALHLYPIVYLNAAAALANIDPAMEQAAANLGAGAWTTFRRVTLPLMGPGLFAGLTIVFIWSFTELGTPLVFDFHTVTPVQIFFGVQEVTQSPRPFALVAVMLGFSVVFYAMGKMALGRDIDAGGMRAMVGSTARRLSGFKAAFAAVPFVMVTALAMVPQVGVVLGSFAEPGSWYRSVLPAHWTTAHYAAALSHPLSAGAIRNSLGYSAAAMGLDLGLGLVIAWLIVRGRVWGSRVLDSLAMLPLAVPGVVLALGFVAVSLKVTGWCRSWGVEPPSWVQVVGENPDPVVFLVIAYAVRRLPYVVRSAAAGLQQTAGELEEAARNLGAGAVYTLRRIIVPLIAANLVAGGVLAFSFAMLEVSDSLILAQREGQYPITKAIYAMFERLGDGPQIASALGVWGMALLGVTLVAASMMLGRRMGAMFRI